MAFPVHIVAVGGIVENQRGEVLIVKNRHYNRWDIPGGQVEVGENLIDALIREIKEESGADVSVERLVGVTSNTGTYEGYNHVGIVPTKVMFDFVCRYTGGTLRGSDETSDPTWIPRDQLLDHLDSPHMAARMGAYLDGGGVQYLDYALRPEYRLKLKRSI